MAESCKNKVEYLYSWNGELIRGCKEHADQMATVAAAMGGPMQMEKIKAIEPMSMCGHKEPNNQ